MSSTLLACITKHVSITRQHVSVVRKDTITMASCMFYNGFTKHVSTLDMQRRQCAKFACHTPGTNFAECVPFDRSLVCLYFLLLVLSVRTAPAPAPATAKRMHISSATGLSAQRLPFV